MNLYKFISFEKFVDMIQRQELHFVHPSKWDDPKELWGVECLINSIDDVEAKNRLIFAYGCHFAQSWTKISETDALWRIYVDKSSSVRICIRSENVMKLDNVVVREVKYVADIKGYASKLNQDIDGLEKSFTVKTNFFRHEEEYRLIYQINKTYKEMADAFLVAMPDILKEKREVEACKTSARRDMYDIIRKKHHVDAFHKVSFAGIGKFIESVMISPHAHDWEISMVKTFCCKYGLQFIGKSNCYSIPSYEE